ncbi:Uu.00g093490.m01.CDS01 [Anthostomella pinea]|uniref:mRNA export factor GLE1 n=1 Tax=Anthostomella pinea TaxID=933095 RepID=A0AAI8YKP7_9PEZI|nr:Uu.00g093490.m01.CDS01 [Anthostomella pinea]
MAGSSPAARRTHQWSSPNRDRLSDLLSENRHTELSHQDALNAAQAEHDRVREAAIRVFREHELHEEHKKLREREERIRQQQRLEEERIRTEEHLRAEEERLRTLKAKTVPQLPPPPPSPPASTVNRSAAPKQPEPTPSAAPQVQSSLNAKASTFATTSSTVSGLPQVNGTKAEVPSPAQPSQQPPQALSSARPSPFAQPSATNPFAQPSITGPSAQPAAANPFARQATSQQNGQATQPAATTAIVSDNDRYVQIHQNLKRLRASLAQQAKSLPPLKARMGDMRRELRKNMGQLVNAKGGNKVQIEAIQRVLHESISGSVPSALVDPADYITDRREPSEGAIHNGRQLPSLFIYLLNTFSKAVINQFIDECGAQPLMADPVGVIVAMIFSNKSFLWRGKTLIDILMAKFRVVCPVLFGYRGSEKTEQGRKRLGWKREKGASWVPEQQHTDRMKGLGVGYAAIALRDFSKSPNTNPWPPSRYWASFAKIVNTPSAEITNTHAVVLRAMIEVSEERFCSFYGTAAIAALRKALVDFPNRAEIKTPGVSGLLVLGQMFRRDIGLEL